MKILVLSWLAFAAIFIIIITMWLVNVALTFEFTSLLLHGLCYFSIGGGVLTLISIGAIMKEFADISPEQQ